MIKTAIQRATDKDRLTLLLPATTQKSQTKIIPFTVIYNPLNPPISKICQKNRHILASAPDAQELLIYNFMVVTKRARNIKQLLTKTDINPQPIPLGSGPCNIQCVSCRFLKPTRTITVSATQETIPIRGQYNCKTKNVIYVISCIKCGLQYVGQTGNTFNERFRAHLTDIRQENNMKPVSHHFTSNGHNVDDVTATTVTQTTDDINVRLRTEEVWIHIFKSRQPTGLNLKQ